MGTVLIDTAAEGIAVVIMNRPDRLNAMSDELVDDLHSAFDAVGRDPDCRVVILTGAGRGFCAGLDIAAGRDDGDSSGENAPAARLRRQQRIATLITRMRAMRQPVVAAVNGPAAGGGFALALGADIRIASENARFNVAFIRIGLSGCDIGVSYLLPRLIGASRAFELMLTGRIVDAAEAERIGLVTRVVRQDQVMNAAFETARLLLEHSPFGLWMTKEVMWSNLETSSLQAAIDLENRTQVLTTFTGDMDRAVAAFQRARETRSDEPRT